MPLLTSRLHALVWVFLCSHPRFGWTRCCLHATLEELGARSPDVAAPQRSTAADVGHRAGAECCAIAGAAPEFLEVSWKVDISRRCHDITELWFQIFFIFYPYLGKWSNLTNIFQMGWNHQLDYRWLCWFGHCWFTVNDGYYGWSQCIITGFGTSQVVQDVHPCDEELPPWFLERQNISRRHPGHGHSGKLPCLVFIVSIYVSIIEPNRSNI